MGRLPARGVWPHKLNISVVALAVTFIACGGRVDRDSSHGSVAHGGGLGGAEGVSGFSGFGGQGGSPVAPPPEPVCNSTWFARRSADPESTCVPTQLSLRRLDGTCSYDVLDPPIPFISSDCALTVVSGDSAYAVFVAMGAPCDRISGAAWHGDPNSTQISVCPCVCDYVNAYDVEILFECGCGGPIWTG